MADLTLRLVKGTPLTNQEVDDNFSNLNEGQTVAGEPMGHADKAQSTLSFDSSTRTVTIAPVGAEFVVWCKAEKYVFTTAQTVQIPNTTGIYYIYFNASGVLSYRTTYFDWPNDAPTAYVYWNATTGTAPFFADERHGITLDWQTHEYLHRTRGAALANGFSIANYTTTGTGSADADAQFDLSGGTFFDEDLQVDITATSTPVANTWQQDLTGPAQIPVFYRSGTSWVRDTPTNFVLKAGTATPRYNTEAAGVWGLTDVPNNSYSNVWILATNNLTYPVIAIMGQYADGNASNVENSEWSNLNLDGFPVFEFRPLYKIVFQCSTNYANTIKARFTKVFDIRNLAAASVAATIGGSHSTLSGLGSDDHLQYLHISEVRTPSAAVTNSFLPVQAGQTGKYLTTDGSNPSWGALPSSSLTFTGDVTGSGNTGSSTALTLAASGVAAGTYGSATAVPVITVDTKGRLTSVTTNNISGSLSFTGDVTGLGNTGSATTLTLANSGVTAGAYGDANNIPQLTVDAKGRVTAVSNVAVNIPSGSLTFTGDVTGTGSTGSSTTLTLANSGVAAGTYTKVTVDAKGRVTTGAALASGDLPTYTGSLISSQITNALGYTPLSNAVSYLPLTGGTLTGALNILKSGDPYYFYFSPTFSELQLGGDGVGIDMGATTNTYASYIQVKGANGTSLNLRVPKVTNNYSYVSGGGVATTGAQLRFVVENSAANSTAVVIASHTGSAFNTFTFNSNGSLSIGGSTSLHAGNYNSYAPTLTGTGASGTWGINITGNAATATSATDSTKLPLSGGTLTGSVSFAQGANINFGTSTNEAGPWTISVIASGGATPATKGTGRGRNLIIKAGDSDNGAGLAGGDMFVRGGSPTSPSVVYGDVRIADLGGQVYLRSGEIAIGSGNYSSYALPLSGGTLTGTVQINTTGSGSSTSHVIIKRSGASAPGSFGSYSGLWRSSIEIWNNDSTKMLFLNSAENDSGYANIKSVGGGFFIDVGASGATRAIQIESSGSANFPVGLAQGGNAVLTTGNYSNYALPLSGGTVSGNLGLGVAPDTRLSVNGAAHISSFLYMGGTAGTTSSWGSRDYTSGSSRYVNANYFEVNNYGYGSNWTFAVDGSSSRYNGNVILHAGNYSSYAVPLSGGTMTGDLVLSSSWGSGSYNEQLIIYASYPSMTFRSTTSDTGWLFHTDSGGSWTLYSIAGATTNNWTQRYTFNTDGTFRNGGPSGNVYLHGGNYNSFSPTLTGGGASGTWSINVTGNAGSASTASSSPLLSALGNYVWSSATSPASYNQGIQCSFVYSGWQSYGSVMTMKTYSAGGGSLQLYVPYSPTYGGTGLQVRFGNYDAGDVWTSWKTLLASDNYNSYSPTLTGTGASGTWGINVTGYSKWIDRVPNYQWNNATLPSGYNSGVETSFVSAAEGWPQYGVVLSVMGRVPSDPGGNFQLYMGHGSNYGGVSLRVRSVDQSTNGWTSWRTILDAGNYSSYAMPLSGGTFTGAITAPDIYTNSGWFRNHTNNNGIYWSQTGWHLYPTSAGSFYFRSGQGDGSLHFINSSATSLGYVHAASDAAMGFLTTGGSWRFRVDNSGNARCYNNLYLDQNYGHGIVGVYASTRYQGVFAMGDSYKLAADGTSTGSLYGMAWSHPNAGGVAGNLDSHGMIVMINGGFGSCMSYSIKASANVTAYSDERLKTNWRAMPENYVARLAQVKVGIYDRTDVDQITQVGVGAQSLQALLPEAVITADDEIKTLSVAYGNAALASAVELAKEIVKLREEIELLKAKLN